MWLNTLKGLAGSSKWTSVRFSIETGNKQASGAKKLCNILLHKCYISALTQPLKGNHYFSGQGHKTNFDRDTIKVAELDDLNAGE